jgi:hypothetical protein
MAAHYIIQAKRQYVLNTGYKEAHHTFKPIRQHIIHYRLYGSTLYNRGYTAAHSALQAIQQHIIYYMI